MITIKEFPSQTFETKEEMFKSLKENKDDLIAQKKMITKKADALTIVGNPMVGKLASKAILDLTSISTLKMDLVINTSNILDSHSDVHIGNIWSKSLKEKKDFYLLKEHKMSFESIITDDVKATVKQMTWNELGFNAPGSTSALMFQVNVSKERHEFMFGQYAKGFVKNHSVGMRYVKLELALNSESRWDEEEKEVWDKYISEIINKEVAENQGYFWAVTEAKVIEGSAVPVGSNILTPVASISAKSEPPASTHSSTQDEPPKGINFKYLSENIKINFK